MIFLFLSCWRLRWRADLAILAIDVDALQALYKYIYTYNIYYTYIYTLGRYQRRRQECAITKKAVATCTDIE